MKVIALEIRDRATYIAAFAVSMIGFDNAQQSLLRRSGYGDSDPPMIALTRMELPSKCTYHPYEWGDRTMCTAHKYIAENFHSLQNGDVIDVEFILGETTTKKQPEGTH